jgi:hypothetical protein
MRKMFDNRRPLPIGVIAAGIAMSAVTLAAAPAKATSCTTVSACLFGDNVRTTPGSGIGADAGVFGLSERGDGIDGETTRIGNSTSASSGIAGYDKSRSGAYNAGVFGYSSLGTGVHGTTGSGIGVYGNAVGGASGTVGIGVYGKATGTGCCVNDYGVYGRSDNGIAIFGVSQNQVGVVGNSNTGIGITGGSVAGYSGMIIQGPIGIV